MARCPTTPAQSNAEYNRAMKRKAGSWRTKLGQQGYYLVRCGLKSASGFGRK